ncbi:cellulose biosynthesis cyclic di-GMP-binding regulatory protein BcsB [Erwinia mallotivora]|uniref:cellulose biosynthesis cyclic di-GMP-binding regulatory protein BcsB n=1 Tax=Erwinia mallotivora TaxID=69222 RepID=UPI0021BE24D2|nr:cellulose biosynthesis cyclic di-GMP-binding regulatory protein BcsB [Erwinia mallotivora]
MKGLFFWLGLSGLMLAGFAQAASGDVTQDSRALSLLAPPADVGQTATRQAGRAQTTPLPGVVSPQSSAAASSNAVTEQSQTPVNLPPLPAPAGGQNASPSAASTDATTNGGQSTTAPAASADATANGGQSATAPAASTDATANGGQSTTAPAASADATTNGGQSTTAPAASADATTNGGQSTTAPAASADATANGGQSAIAPAASTDATTSGGQSAIAPSPAVPDMMLNQPLASTVSVAQMGQPGGITLTGGQLQSGIIFTLPSDEVITNARLNLSLKVSQALAARNTSLQLMLNGQPLGTLPLSASDSASEDYQLDIPAAMVVSSNNLSFKINDADQLLCERDSASQYQVTILPKSTLSLEGQQLNMGNALRNFPRPFIDSLRMTPSSVTMIFGQSVTPGQVSAAAIVSSWMGIQTDYRGIHFPVLRNELPEKNGIIFARPGETIAGLPVPEVSGPTLQLVDNPANPVYKLMLVIGKTDDDLRQAAWRLTLPLSVDSNTLSVAQHSMPVSKAYDAPRWINTDRPVPLRDLLRKDQSLTTNGIWHDALRVNFRAAPDLFLWDGDSLPVHLSYRFPSESWIDENKSFLNVTLNGTFLRNLTVNKVGLLENIWHRLGGDARQEHYTLKLDPYLIYGDNQLQLYFSIKPKENAPCGVLTNNNIKSRIEDDAFIDLSHTRHFTLLPNLSYFVGASFPFSRFADYSQTVLMLASQPGNAEISALLDLAGRSGNATGVALYHNSVMFGIPAGGTLLQQLQNSDVLAVSTLAQTAFNQSMLRDSPFEVNSHTLGVKEPGWRDNLRGWLTGDWYRQALDADRYFSSNEDWRGFVSYRSPWSTSRVVIMTVATDDAQLSRLHNDLSLARINAGIRGDTAIITDENGIRSFHVGAQFPSGQMPWYMMVVWYANQHAVLLAFLALLISAIIGLSTCVLLKKHAWKRLNPQNDARGKGDKK